MASEDQGTITPVVEATSRVESFRELAERIADGEQIVPPRLLTGHDRRQHVRSTLREDHATRIVEEASGTREKFDELADSLFSFFRGTALLFYRDMVGADAHMPTVLALGDVHPENFGVMPNADGVPIFSVNDFDEALYAPFTWDIKRGAVGFWIAAEEEGGLDDEERAEVLRSFVRGYMAAMEKYADGELEKKDAFQQHNSPTVIQRLFDEAWEDRETWLWDDYFDEQGRGFRADDPELEPITSRVDEFQELVEDLVESNGIDPETRLGELRVKDVCKRHGQGTASLGLARYYALLEGPSEDATDDVIIEFKRARRSALHGLVPPTDYDAGEKAERIVHGQGVQLAQGDVFYGSVEIDGTSFMTRERAPFRDDIDLDELSTDTWGEYADACGRALAQAHALSDDLGQVDYDVEPSIVQAAHPTELLVADVVTFATETAERLERDHEGFVEDVELGAYDTIDRVYR